MVVACAVALAVAAGTAACSPHPAASAPAAASDKAPRYGEVMTEVGRRFELLGRAALARRFELADYQLGELQESVAGLERAEPPRESAGVDLKPLARAFVSAQPPALAAALRSHDAATFARAFHDAAAQCNACHQASGHRFIEVPEAPGQPVPRLDPQ